MSETDSGPAPPMPGTPAQVLVMTGTPGVGKSTAARRLAASLPLCAHVGADTLQRMIQSGGEWPSSGTPAAVAQLVLRTRHAGMLAASFAQAGIPAIVDDVITLPAQVEVLERELETCRFEVVGLTAAEEAVRSRDAGRHKRTAALYGGTEPRIRATIAATWIDTAGQSIDETVEAVRRIVCW